MEIESILKQGSSFLFEQGSSFALKQIIPGYEVGKVIYEERQKYFEASTKMDKNSRLVRAVLEDLKKHQAQGGVILKNGKYFAFSKKQKSELNTRIEKIEGYIEKLKTEKGKHKEEAMIGVAGSVLKKAASGVVPMGDVLFPTATNIVKKVRRRAEPKKIAQDSLLQAGKLTAIEGVKSTAKAAKVYAKEIAKEIAKKATDKGCDIM